MATIAATPQAGAATSAGARTRSRSWAWLGLGAFILGFLVTWGAQFSVPMGDLNAGGQQMMDSLDTTENEIIYRVSSGIGYLAVAALLAFGVGLRNFLMQRATGETNIPNIILGSILITAAALGLAMSFRAQVFDTIMHYDDSTASHITLNRLQQDTVLAAWATMLAATVATTIGGFKMALVPRGIAWFSGLVSVLIVIFCLAGAAFPSNVPALLWLGVMAIWAIRASGKLEA